MAAGPASVNQVNNQPASQAVKHPAIQLDAVLDSDADADDDVDE